MPYIQTLNTLHLSAQEKQFLKREFDDLRAELDDVRGQMSALLAKLDGVGGGFPDDFEATITVADPKFTAK